MPARSADLLRPPQSDVSQHFSFKSNSTSGPKLGTVERAYEIARSGKAASVTEIRYILMQEGHFDVAAHLGGGSIKVALRALCAAHAPK